MNYKQRTIPILIASLITAGFNYIFNTLTSEATSHFAQDYGFISGILLSFFVSTLVNVSAGFPALLVKSIRSVPHIVSIAVFATIEASWLFFLLTIPVIILWGFDILLPLRVISILVAFFGADALFNAWNARFRYKLAIAVCVVVLTIGIRFFL